MSLCALKENHETENDGQSEKERHVVRFELSSV